MKSIKYIFCAFILNFHPIIAQTFSWQEINTLFGGKVYTLMKDSTNSIYCGTYKGIYKTTDPANSWKHISNKKFKAEELTSVNQNFYLCAYQTAVLYSTDQGVSWDSLIASPYGEDISCIYTKNNNLFIGTGELTFLFSSNMGISWETTNLNDFWPPYSYDFISAIEVVNDSILFVGSAGSGLFIVNSGYSIIRNINNLPDNIFDFEQHDSSKIYCGTSNGIYISTDIGQNWDLVGIEERNIYSLKSNSNYFFAGTDSGMYISTDNGLNWESKTFNNIYPTIYDILIIDSEKVYAATSFGIYTSSDNGRTWNQNNYGINAVGGIYDILTKNDTILLATSNGFYRSNDNGTSWERKGNGLNENLIISVTLDESSNIYAGTTIGVFKSNDNGETWNYILSGSFLRNVASFNDIVFAAKAWLSSGNGTYRSSDHGSSWQIIPEIEGTINSFCLLPGGYIIAGGDNLYISSDGGITWNQLQSPISGGGEITDFKSEGNNLYVVGDMAGAFLSTDLGNNWTPLGLEWMLLSAVDAYHDSVFVGVNNAVNNPEPDGPFLSTNRGTSWTTINLGLSNSSVISFCFDSHGYLLAGTRDGIYISSKQIATYVKNEISNFPIEFTLSQNYPNPFNPTTKIKFTIPNVGRRDSSPNNVVLKVYDVLGNEIATLVNEEKSTGNYEVEFDASNLTSGIYFYQLKAGSFVETRKMLLLR